MEVAGEDVPDQLALAAVHPFCYPRLCLTQWTDAHPRDAFRPTSQSGNRRILEAMANAGEPTVIGDQLHYVRSDSLGVVLEVVAVPGDRYPGGLAVIHAMPVNFRRMDSERT